jgi:hypothetical protein
MTEFLEKVHSFQRQMGEVQAALLGLNVLTTKGKLNTVQLSTSSLAIPKTLSKKVEGLIEELLRLLRLAESVLCNSRMEGGSDAVSRARSLVLQANLVALFDAVNSIEEATGGYPRDFSRKLGPELEDFMNSTL